ncbi:Reticulon-like protein B22 [Platanthera guangdongensis]|uniref:Reticulon-like protein B22 n=1 Tax=Platanthera guangdongensis TaxID=2320717 RepID=A0ABR2MUV0_9ASPA
MAAARSQCRRVLVELRESFHGDCKWQVQVTRLEETVWRHVRSSQDGSASSGILQLQPSSDLHEFQTFQVIAILYTISVLGRVASGVTIAYAGLCLFCLYIFAQNSLIAKFALKALRESAGGTQKSL